MRSGLGHTIRAASPIGDLGLVDLVALVVDRRQAGSGANGAVHVDQAAADATDQVVVVVAHAIFEACGRAGRLNASNQALGHQHAKCVVHRLKRDGTDLGAHDLGHAVRRNVGLMGDGPQNGQPLRGHLDTASSQELSRFVRHASSIDQTFESINE